MTKQAIATDAAPAAIGTYSQAVRSGNTVYFSGQIPLDPKTQQMVNGDFDAHVERVFRNLRAVAEEAGGDLDRVVKLTVYLIDLGNFAAVNACMERFFSAPYPARAALAVAALPKGAVVEVEAVMELS